MLLLKTWPSSRSRDERRGVRLPLRCESGGCRLQPRPWSLQTDWERPSASRLGGVLLATVQKARVWKQLLEMGTGPFLQRKHSSEKPKLEAVRSVNLFVCRKPPVTRMAVHYSINNLNQRLTLLFFALLRWRWQFWKRQSPGRVIFSQPLVKERAFSGWLFTFCSLWLVIWNQPSLLCCLQQKQLHCHARLLLTLSDLCFSLVFRGDERVRLGVNAAVMKAGSY